MLRQTVSSLTAACRATSVGDLYAGSMHSLVVGDINAFRMHDLAVWRSERWQHAESHGLEISILVICMVSQFGDLNAASMQSLVVWRYQRFQNAWSHGLET
jgi:hypothetical protein